MPNPMPDDIIARCPGCQVQFRAADLDGRATCPVCGASLKTKTVAAPPQPQAPPAETASKTGRNTLLAAAVIAVLLFLASTQVTFFVVQPIGAVPEGRTILISRLNKTNFIDSADAMCERLTGKVNLICRGMMMGAVAEKSDIILRLPYSETLYLISTDGKKYDK